jgi:hypothetical protein
MTIEARRPSLAVAGLLLLLAGCATEAGYDPGMDSFGNAVRQNVVVQSIHPEGAPQPTTAGGMNAARGAIAYQRYQADKVKKPEGIGTTTIMSTGSQ